LPRRRRVPGEVREVERDKWQATESTRDPEGFYMVVVSSVYGGFRRKRLGGVGGFSGAALYAEFSDVVAAVGGGTVRSGEPRVQRVCD
jgi:hypothetical protein